MKPDRAARRPALLLSLAPAAGALTLPAAASTGLWLPGGAALASDATSLVKVPTPTRADKDRLIGLGLDPTERFASAG